MPIVGRAQSVLEASVCGRKRATGTTARFFFAFDADNVVAPPTTCLVPVVHRTRPRCVVAVRHLWSVVEVVESQTALPTTERLAITVAEMHTQV